MNNTVIRESDKAQWAAVTLAIKTAEQYRRDASHIPWAFDCVVGDGVELKYIPKGKRSVYRRLVMRASDQGSAKSEYELAPCVRYLQSVLGEHNVSYSYGRLD